MNHYLLGLFLKAKVREKEMIHELRHTPQQQGSRYAFEEMREPMNCWRKSGGAPLRQISRASGCLPGTSSQLR